MLTSKAGVDDRLEGFDSGADDYLVKPFAFEELSARIKAIIARSGSTLDHAIRIDHVCIDLQAQLIYVDDEIVFFPHQEYTLLISLINNRGRVLSRRSLHELLDEDADSQSNLLEVLIYNLRQKLGKGFIKTIRGHGYMIPAPS